MSGFALRVPDHILAQAKTAAAGTFRGARISRQRWSGPFGLPA